MGMELELHFTLLRRFGARLSELRDGNGGNVAVIFALATVPIIGSVGAAVDYSRANAIKAAMQAAADSTALMIAKNAMSMSESEIKTKGNDYFNAMFIRPDAKNLKLDIAYTTNSGSQVTVKANAEMKTDFVKMLGLPNLKIGADAQARWGNTRLRVALALDNTGSMAEHGKMDALKTATKGLLDQLKESTTKDGDVYVSIIPFNKDVNVGKSNHSEPWVRWTEWDEENGDDVSTTKCTSSKGRKKKCTTSTSWVPDNHHTWNGCVMDRDKDYDTKNTAPNTAMPATLFPAEQYDDCPVEMMPLTYDWNQLNMKVNTMKPAGMTNQTIGLQWAFQSLTSPPLTIPPKDSSVQYTEAIILLTDGLNTENRFDDNTSTIDQRTLATCANAKTAGITVYVVQVNTGGDPTQTFLKTCASSPDKFVELKSANQMVTTFNTIGTALTKLRLAQ